MAPSPSIERIHTDVLIIGAGAAGLRAAIETRKKNVDVLIVCKGKVGRSGATFYPSSPTRGIQASSGIGIDTVDRHIQDILNVGLGEADYNLAEILASEAPKRLEDLLTFGVGLAKRDGEIIREPGCFSKVPRAAIIENVGDFASCLINNVNRMGGKLYEQLQIVKLFVTDNRIYGALGIGKAGEVVEIYAKAVIIAAGGGAGVFKNTLTHPEQVGDSYVLAVEVGARIRNIEFFQIMLGTFRPDYMGFFPIDLFRKSPVFRDAKGDSIFDKYISEDELNIAFAHRATHFPFSTRDSSKWIDVAVEDAYKSSAVSVNVDVKMFEIAPFAHAFNGGIVINERCETSVDGLYACGEAATGMHGADRIGGNMLSATQVFGARAGLYAAEKSSRTINDGNPFRYELPPIDCNNGLSISDLRVAIRDIKDVIFDCALVIRSRKKCVNSLLILESINNLIENAKIKDAQDSRLYFSLTNALKFSVILIKAILSRREAIGPHYIIE